MTMVDRFKGEIRSTLCGSGLPLILLCVLLLGLSFSGCASRKEILGFQADSHFIRTKLDTINLNIQNMRMQVEGLQIRQDRLVEEMVTQSDLRQFKAYTGSRLDNYEGQALMISAQINDLSQRLTGVVQQMDQLRYQPLVQPTATDSSDSVATVPEQPPPSPELKELYDQAYSDFGRGNHELAKMGFEEYLRLYPDTELADNSMYWVGEIVYFQHQYKEALTIFEQVREKYPQGNKVPAAMFKVGLCQMALTMKEDAISTFQALIHNYPATPEASQAKDRLTEME